MAERNGKVIRRFLRERLAFSFDPPISPYLQIRSFRRDRLPLLGRDPRPEHVVAAMEEQQLEPADTIEPGKLEAMRKIGIRKLGWMGAFAVGKGLDCTDHLVQVCLLYTSRCV